MNADFSDVISYHKTYKFLFFIKNIKYQAKVIRYFNI